MSFLCSSAPPRNDKLPKEWGGKNYGLLPNQWDVGMVEVPCREPACCLVACVCCPCVQYKMRMLVLDDDMTRYLCCQGYFGPCCCFKPGEMGERSCPHLCLCAEVLCCESCAVSATRLTVMDQYDIASDPCDNRIIACNNILQLCSCACHVLAMVDESFLACAQIIDGIATTVYYTVQSCMTAQTYHEIKLRKAGGSVQQPGAGPPPQGMHMERRW